MTGLVVWNRRLKQLLPILIGLPHRKFVLPMGIRLAYFVLLAARQFVLVYMPQPPVAIPLLITRLQIMESSLCKRVLLRLVTQLWVPGSCITIQPVLSISGVGHTFICVTNFNVNADAQWNPGAVGCLCHCRFRTVFTTVASNSTEGCSPNGGAVDNDREEIADTISG